MGPGCAEREKTPATLCAVTVKTRCGPTRMLPPLRGCRIFVHEHDLSATRRVALHADYTPCDWEHHQHATVLWLSRALLASMHWTVPTAGALQPAPADADLICVCSSSDLLSRHSASESLVHHLLTRACGIEELCPAPGQRKDRRACHGSTAVRQHDNRQLQHNRPVRQHGRRNSISRTAVSAAGSGPLDPHAAPRNQ